jgi:hypothetical protein
MISTVNPVENHIAARLLEYLSTRTPWHRILWNSGSILALREVLEASEAFSQGHLSDTTVRAAVRAALRLVREDPGFGGPAERAALASCLTVNGEARAELNFEGLEYEQIRQFLDDATPQYLLRWADAMESAQAPAAERTSRAIAAHLLDRGYNGNYLHRWWTYRLHADQSAERHLSELVREASGLANRTEQDYEVLIPFPSELKPPQGLLVPQGWCNAAGVSAWVSANGATMPQDFHQQGGLLLTIQALDPESAVQLAAERVELFTARVLLSLRKEVRNCGVAWVRGQTRTYSIERHLRGIRIGAIHREDRLWLETEADPYIDPAIELLAPLQSGASTTAIAGGWAAIEALLGEPKSKKADPAERLAAIVSCSFPRAELTALAYVLRERDADFRRTIDAVPENREKATIVARAIVAGTCPTPTTWADRAAVERMSELLQNPTATLETIKDHVHDAFARMYRQRNLILHAGRTRAVALRSTLRGAAPLVGAGLDRITHARYVDRMTPIQLAGRARTAIATASPDHPDRCVTLLGTS